MSSINKVLDNTPFSIFNEIEYKINEINHEYFYPLHQGKTTFNPDFELDDLNNDFIFKPHEHAPPKGIDIVRKKISLYEGNKNNNKIDYEDVLITCGATHAIMVVLNTIISPSDEVIILSPQWLFINGLICAAHGSPIEIPIFSELCRDNEYDFIKEISNHITNKTKAIYFNTPNNPTGYSMTKDQLYCLASLAKKYNLFIISDNAYYNYDFTEHGFIDISCFDDAKDRTFVICSFSKTYCIPGYRIGYVISPPKLSTMLRKFLLYSVYSITTISQHVAYHVLSNNDKNLKIRHDLVKYARDTMINELSVPNTGSMGGFYTFLDLSDLKYGSVSSFITECILKGVSLAPGEAFGKNYTEYARLCFTAVNTDDLSKAIILINNVYSDLNK